MGQGIRRGHTIKYATTKNTLYAIIVFILYPPDVHRGLIKTHNAPSIRGHCFVSSMKNNLVDKVKLNFLRDI